MRLHAAPPRRSIRMVEHVTLDKYIEEMAVYCGDLSAYTRGHPFTREELEAALSEYEPDTTHSYCLFLLLQTVE